MWKSVSIHILKNTQANKPYGTEDRQVRKNLKIREIREIRDSGENKHRQPSRKRHPST